MTTSSRPDLVQNWQSEYERGRAACARGAFTEAAHAFNAAIRLNANAGELHHDLGVVLFQQGVYDQAFACFQNAIGLNVRMGQAWFNGGNALCAMHRYEEAIPWFKKAIDINPAFAEAHYNLANAYKALERHREAIAHYQRTLAIDARMPEALNNMGTLLLGSGALDDALVCFRRAMALDGDHAQAIYNLSLTLSRKGRPDEAVEYVRRCLSLQPENGEALSLLVSLLQQTCDWTALARTGAQLDRLTEEQLRLGRRPSESPFLNFTRCADPPRNLLISRAWSHWLLQKTNRHRMTAFNFAYRPGSKRIRIAYLSERFRNAATGHLAAGIFRRHDRQRYEIFAYSWGPDDKSFYRRKIQSGVDHFIDIRNLSDLEAAQRINADGIDILVDMMGWMHGHRMGIAALRPAPVQSGYLGYPGTTGAPFIDYLLADRIVVPEEMRRHFSEKIVWLPDCYQPNDPETLIDPVACRRRDYGLPEKAVVLCSFNTDYKIEADTFACWMRIMAAVPQSVLWLLVKSERTRENLRRSADMQGICPKRLVFASPLPKAKHIARLKLADLALDTFTVNGHTTTTDALFAGIAVITCQGRHFASRVAASILKAVGLDDLVTRDVSSYEHLAVALANDPHRLKATQARLAQNRQTHALFDIDRYVKNLEAAYDRMWHAHVDNLQRP